MNIRLNISKVVFILCLCLNVCKGIEIDKKFVSACNASRNDNHKKMHNESNSMGNMEAFLEHSSIMYGLTSVVNLTKVSVACNVQLGQIKENIRDRNVWAIKLLDASGMQQSGFVHGHSFWFGSREGCLEIKQPNIKLSKHFNRSMHEQLITERAPYDVSYRVVYLRHSSPLQIDIQDATEKIIQIGLCMPDACVSSDIELLMKAYINSGLFMPNEFLEAKAEFVQVKELKFTGKIYDTIAFKMCTWFLIFLAVMIIGAWILPAESSEHISSKQSENENSENNQIKSDSNYDAEKEIQRGNEVDFRKIVQCFNIKENLRSIFDIKSGKNREFAATNGLRCLGAILIIPCHVIWLINPVTQNKTSLLKISEPLRPLAATVDIFFTISGFLLTCIFMKNEKLKEIIRQNNIIQNAKAFVMLFVYRMLRICPLYFFSIVLVKLFYDYTDEVSDFYNNDQYNEKCSQHWWRNVLFIQNFFHHSKMCMVWSWFLACEMQFFCFASILIFLYTKYPSFIKLLTVLTLMANILWTYIICYRNNFELSLEFNYAALTTIYMNPFTRITPYIIGAITGWYLVDKGFNINITKGGSFLFWNIVLLILSFIIYLLVKDYEISTFMAISVFVGGRMIFALTVSMIIVQGYLNPTNFLMKMFNAKVFRHIVRISYALYILNPLVIQYFSYMKSATLHTDGILLTVLSVGIMIITYLISVIMSATVELPFCKLAGLLVKSGEKQVMQR